MRHVIRAPLTVLALTVLLVAGGCADQQSQQFTEAAARNTAATAGVIAFEDQNIQLSGGLDCSASATEERIAVTCDGTAKDGRPVTLEGETDGAQGAGFRGSWVGRVDGEEVFAQDCLGC